MVRDIDFARSLDFDLPTFREAKRRDPRVHLAIQRAIAAVDRDLYAAQLRLALSGNPYMLGWLGRHRLQQNQQPLQLQHTSLNLNVTVDQLLDPANISEEQKTQLRLLRQSIYGEDTEEIPDIRDVDAEEVPSTNGENLGSGD